MHIACFLGRRQPSCSFLPGRRRPLHLLFQNSKIHFLFGWDWPSTVDINQTALFQPVDGWWCWRSSTPILQPFWSRSISKPTFLDTFSHNCYETTWASKVFSEWSFLFLLIINSFLFIINNSLPTETWTRNPRWQSPMVTIEQWWLDKINLYFLQ